MFALDLLSENINGPGEYLVEGLGEEFTPGIEGISEMETANLRDQFLVESAVLLASNKQAVLISEGAQEEAATLSENVMKNIYEKIKTLIKKMWARMKDFFKGVRIFFDKLTMNEAKFAEKYEKEIKAIKSVKVEGHDIKPDAINLKTAWGKGAAIFKKEQDAVTRLMATCQTTKSDDDAKAAYEKAVKEVNKTADFDKTVAGQMVSGATGSSDFKKKAAAVVGYKPAKVTISFGGSEIYGILTGLAQAVNTVKDNEREVDGIYQNALAEVEKVAKLAGVSKANEDISAEWFSKASSLGNVVASNVKSTLGYINSLAGVQISALKEQASLAKKAAYKGIAEARKDGKKAVSESYVGGDIQSIYNELLS